MNALCEAAAMYHCAREQSCDYCSMYISLMLASYTSFPHQICLRFGESSEGKAERIFTYDIVLL